MRLLVVTTDIDRAETRLFVELAKSGIDVHMLCDPQSPNFSRLVEGGVKAHGLSISRRFDGTAIRQIRDTMEAFRPDILHVLRKPALSNALRATKGQPARIVAYRGIVGNLSFFDPISWLTFLNPRVDRVICVAEAIREFFLNMQPAFLRLAQERIVTIHKGHDVAWYRQEVKPSLAEFGISEDALVVGCVAAMRPRKGVDLLIRAFDRIAGQHHAHLLLVGEIRDPRIMKAYAASPNQERIHIAGFRKDAAALSGALDLFVLPSVKREGLPRAAIEAMAQGVPAIVTDAGGSKDLVRPGVDGLVVPAGDEAALADAMSQLLADEALRKRCGASARERIETDFNVQGTVRKTLAVYHDLLNPSRDPAP